MDIYLLDMGTTKYGDCILVTKNDRKILIDGGHPSDANFIKNQLIKILQKQPPFKIDLLVVTHTHSDHIGCLPSLISSGDLQPAKSLLINPEWRWFEGSENDLFEGDFAKLALAEAFNEEDRSDLNDDELEQFLFDAATLKSNYLKMITTLKHDGNVIFYNGIEQSIKDLENEFQDFGFKVLGPTNNHLKITKSSLGANDSADVLSEFLQSISSESNQTNSDEQSISILDTYRKLVEKQKLKINDSIAADAINKGAINNESIVIKLQSEGWSALLAGDMQFAKPEVTGINSEMKKLIETVNQNGPYNFIKTSHHTSYNGLSEDLLDTWIVQGTKLFAHSGGLNDPSHPEEDVLEILKARKNKIKFARTDRNGIIKVSKKENGEVGMFIAKGQFNNFDKNTASGDENSTTSVQPQQLGNQIQPQPPFLQKENTSSDFIEIQAKIPSHLSSVRISIDIDSEKKK